MDNKKSHEHCFHLYQGIIYMCLPDGHVMLKCCKCDEKKTEHRDHFSKWGSK